MNIIDIYRKYHLPENLQMHMLRVASWSNLIIDNWKGQELDRNAIIRVCLLHDMGNGVVDLKERLEDAKVRYIYIMIFQKECFMMKYQDFLQ